MRQMAQQHLDHPYRHCSGEQAVKALIDAMVISHPAVIMPKERTFEGLLRANPRADFLRRLAAANNYNEDHPP